MRHAIINSVLSLAISAAAVSAFAQVAPQPARNAPAPAVNAPAPTANPAAPLPASTEVTATAANAPVRQQIEGQIVDLFDIAQQTTPVSTGSSGTITTGTPELRIQRDVNPQPAAAGNASTSDNGMSYSPAANPNVSISPHVGDSAGTYNHPGAAGGSSDTSASITGSGRLDPGDRPTGAEAAAAAAALPRTEPIRLPAATAVRSQLSAGIPAAIVSGNRTFIIVSDPKQFAQFAGQTVRINGTLTSQNLLIPDRLEVRQPSGTFQEVSLNKPADTMSPRTGTAENR